MNSLFERGYHAASKRYLANQWEVTDAEDPAIINSIFTSDELNNKIGGLSDLEKAILATFLDEGARARGENIRRDLLLRGFEGSAAIIRGLVERAILVPLPNPGEADLDIEQLLDETNTFLQRDLTLFGPVLEALGKLDGITSVETAAAWAGDVDVNRQGSVESLELNLLHISSMLLHERLRLNKSGTPNRRSLARFARGITLPGQVGEAADELDLSDSFQMDYLAFVLAFALEIGLIRKRGHTIVASGEEMETFFTSDAAERDKRIASAASNLKFWSELRSSDLAERIDDAEQQLSQFEPTGEPLIPGRGYIFSLLKRSNLGEWTSIAILAKVAQMLDEDYLPRVLGKVAKSAQPKQYVEALVNRLMSWTGMVDLGEASDGESVVRFTPRGKRMLGMDPEIKVPEPEGEHGCMVVQPNKEVMVFLDAAPLRVIFDVYRVAERRKLSDRVATFDMTTESVQRGYAQGTNAEHILETLNAATHSPVPESIAFQLEDWERMHRRQRIYANGILIRHPDPDQLDLITGQLRHENRDNEKVQILPLGPTSAFLTAPDAEGLTRFIEREGALVIDYLGDIPPPFDFVDPLVVMFNPIHVDIVTKLELARVAHKQDDELGDHEFWEFDIKLIRKRWLDDPLAGIVEFLNPRCSEGLPPSQYIILKSRLEKPPEATATRRRTVLDLEREEDANVFDRIDDADVYIERRLGPTSFLLVENMEEATGEWLDELGIKHQGL
jgi:hypothetical protein